MEPFFISTEEKPFDVSNFYSVSTDLTKYPAFIFILTVSISPSCSQRTLGTRMDYRKTPLSCRNPFPFLVSKIFYPKCVSTRFQNGPCSVSLSSSVTASQLESKGAPLYSYLAFRILTICRRYGLVTEQKKGAYKYFVDLGDRMEVATVRTSYVDEVRTDLFH